MFVGTIDINPVGQVLPHDDDRIPLLKLTGGDDIQISTYIQLPDIRVETVSDNGDNGGDTIVTYEPQYATPENSTIVFALSEDRFNKILYQCDWDTGVTVVDDAPGLVTVKIPSEFTAKLRRGSYAFSWKVTFDDTTMTAGKGNILVEYEPTNDNKSIPYRRFRD